MKINKEGLDLIKSFEGCVLHAYDDGYGNITIGWGHCDKSYAGKTITQADADRLLEQDLKRFEDAVNKYVSTYNLNANEFSALVSFTYNCGEGCLDELLHNGTVNRSDITYRMGLYVHSGSEVVEGLVRRRAAEVELFNKPCYSNSIDYYFNLIADTLKGKYGVDAERKKKLGKDYEIIQEGINTLYDYLRKNVR